MKTGRGRRPRGATLPRHVVHRERVMSEPRAAASQVMSIAEQVEARFRGGRRVLSFAEFLALFDAEPVRQSRDASRYLRDVFDHYGKTKIVHPWGEFTRYNLFDLPWEPVAVPSDGKERPAAPP